MKYMILFKPSFLFSVIFFGLLSNLIAQEDLLSLLEDKAEPPRKVYATFKTTKIGNAQTIETVKKKHLDFRISHRFGNVYNTDDKNPINASAQSFFGFDNASDIRFSFDYGLTDKIAIGIGRSRMNHIVDGNIKCKILQQTANFKMPISLTFFSSMGYSHNATSIIYEGVIKDFKTNELDRFNYFNQLIIASKISEVISLEILPSYMYRNFIKESINIKNGAADQNGFFSLGFGGRVKLTKRVSIIGDYFYNFSQYYKNNTTHFNPLSLGVELETGGHVFSLFYTNSAGLIENNFIPHTTDSWAKGQVKFGFCISRTFAL